MGCWAHSPWQQDAGSVSTMWFRDPSQLEAATCSVPAAVTVLLSETVYKVNPARPPQLLPLRLRPKNWNIRNLGMGSPAPGHPRPAPTRGLTWAAALASHVGRQEQRLRARPRGAGPEKPGTFLQ